MTIIDTHLHVIEQSQLHYPWLAGVPVLNRDFSYSAYAAEAKRCGITDALHMEADVAESDIEAETEAVRGLVNQKDSLVRAAIASCRPESESFPAYLDKILADPLVAGLRRVLHVMPDTLSQSRLFRDNVARLAGTRLTFDLCVLPNQIGQTLALIDSAPDVPFILDHCGVPSVRDGTLEPWVEGLRAIAARPNVVVKISGIIAYSDPKTWTVASLRPFVEHSIESFGWRRVLWGSDWPVVTQGGSLSTWVAATHALLEGCGEDEKTALLSGNARRLWPSLRVK